MSMLGSRRSSGRGSALAVVLVMLLATTAAAAGKTHVRPSATPERWGYVWADQPTGGDYTPDRSYQRSSRGKVNVIQRDGFVGLYRVLFRGLWSFPNDGTVNITDYGAGERTACGIELGVDDDPWYVVSHTVMVEEHCRELPLISADARFDVTYAVRTEHTGRYAYLWADQPASPSYTPLFDHQFNSAGLTNTITHDSIGHYAVHLPGVNGGANGGTVKVTPEQGKLCNVSSWGSNDVEVVVFVRCFNLDGTPRNARFTMTFANKINLLGNGKGYAYAWANKSSSPSYTPDPHFSASKPGGDITIARHSPGIYTVSFAGAGTAIRSHVQLTAYGNTSNQCRVQGWGPNGAGQAVGVECYDIDGNAADTRFTIQFMR
jgi:hypothetical protein